MPENGDDLAGRAGLDRLSFSFPVRRIDDRSSAPWDSVTTRRKALDRDSDARDKRAPASRTWTANVRSPSGLAVFVGAMELEEGLWAKCEANPARLSDPDGCGLATLDDLRDAAAEMWEAASGLVDGAEDLDAAHVKRIDVARDFAGIRSPSLYVHGLLNVRRPHARKAYVYADPTRGSAETLAVGSGAGVVRLYDQHQAYAHKGAEVGDVRWECEARSGWLGKFGMKRLADVEASKLDRLARYRWEWSGMGLKVAATEEVIDRVLDSGLSGAKQQRLLGHLLLKAYGRPSLMGKNQLAEYERYARSVGVLMRRDEGGDDLGVAARLDYETGRELVEVAA